jgi:glycosyltransferase involved in cell wall biosynthesis
VRILHVSDCYLPALGGIELQVHDLAARQRLAGHDVGIVTATPATDEEGPLISVPTVRGVLRPAALAQLRDVLLTGFDVVHGHSSLVSPLSWYAIRTARDVGIPAVLTMHSMMPAGFIVPRVGRLLSSVVQAALLTGVSTAAAAAFERALAGPAVRVLPNGIDPDEWRPRQSHKNSHVLTIVSVMRLAARKRPLQLLRILRHVRRMVPASQPLRAVIVGAGPLESIVRQAVHSSNLRDWVSLPGRLPRPKIQRLFEQSDLYLAPARLESFGIAALEARCAGLPVVAMDCGGVADFVSPGVEGFLAHTDAGMARTAATLLNTPDRLSEIRRHNLASEPVMSWPHVLALTADLYQEAAATISYEPASQSRLGSR